MSLGTTGELHDKSTLRIAKMNLEQCPDTRHTVAFPTDTFDIKFKTLPILLAEMRHHARLHLSGAGELPRRAGDHRAAAIAHDDPLSPQSWSGATSVGKW